jgi:hypothetical protein
MTLTLTDILPELLRSAREIITKTAGLRQFAETRPDPHAGYPLDGRVVAAIATESRALETAVLTLEQTLAEMEADRRRLEAAFAALTSDDQEESPRRPMVQRLAEEAPVVAATPVPVSVPVAMPPAPLAVPPAPEENAAPKKSGKKVKRCKKCHKRKKCRCGDNDKKK